MSIAARLSAGRSRLSALFVEREIFLRSGGRVRFVRITRAAQVRVAMLVGLALFVWAAVTAVMAGLQVKSAFDHESLARAQAEVARQAAANAAFRAELLGKFIELAKNPAVATASQITA